MTTSTASDVLRSLGLVPGEVLGSGMEGVVFALDDASVAKVWHGRDVADLARLRTFYDAVAAAGLPFATPRIHDLHDIDGRAVTVEDRLPGIPLGRLDDEDGLPERTVTAMVDVLAALAAADVVPGMDLLPALPGEPPLAGDFPGALAALVERRVAGSASVLRSRLPDVDRLTAATVTGLRVLGPLGRRGNVGRRLVHGDLIAPNVHVDGDRVVAVLDFGFLSTIGDPAFDAAVTASIVDMYGPAAREHETRLDAAIADRLPYPPERLALYRAAYALATATCFSSDGTDGHFAWCAAMLERADVLAGLD